MRQVLMFCGSALLWLIPKSAFADPPATTEVRRRELESWLDPITGTTSQLVRACDQVAEVRLLGGASRYFLDLTIWNEGTQPVTLEPASLSADFKHRPRQPLTALSIGDTRIARGRWLQRTFSFPKQVELEQEERLQVHFQVRLADGRPCSVVVALARPSQLPTQPVPIVHPKLETELALGAHFAASGSLRTVAKDIGPKLDVGVAVFPWVQHGVSLELANDVFGSSGASAVTPRSPNGKIAGGGLMAGYLFRTFPSRRVTLTLGVDLGPYSIGLEDGDATPAKKWSLAMRQKLRLSFNLGRIAGSGIELGPGFVCAALPIGSFGATHAFGELFSGALYLVFSE